MHATLTIAMNTAPFHEEPASELGEILRNAARRIERGELPEGGFPLLDSRGQHVGDFTIHVED